LFGGTGPAACRSSENTPSKPTKCAITRQQKRGATLPMLLSAFCATMTQCQKDNLRASSQEVVNV
jgi:hypothetical protein